MPDLVLAPSLLAADFARLADQVEAAERAGAHPEIEEIDLPLNHLRNFRLVTGLFLVLVLLTSVALPLFLSWVHARSGTAVPELESAAPARSADEPYWIEAKVSDPRPFVGESLR